MKIQKINVVLLYANMAILLLVGLLSYIYNYEISDVFGKFGLDIGNWVNIFFDLYVIWYLFIPLSINYISTVLFQREILGILLKSFAFLHIIWFLLFILLLLEKLVI